MGLGVLKFYFVSFTFKSDCVIHAANDIRKHYSGNADAGFQDSCGYSCCLFVKIVSFTRPGGESLGLCCVWDLFSLPALEIDH